MMCNKEKNDDVETLWENQHSGIDFTTVVFILHDNVLVRVICITIRTSALRRE